MCGSKCARDSVPGCGGEEMVPLELDSDSVCLIRIIGRIILNRSTIIESTQACNMQIQRTGD
jgi:hypothetical protein